jgi:hypothetical protein
VIVAPVTAAHAGDVLRARERLGRMSHGPRAGRWRDVLLLENRLPEAGD